MIKIERRTPRAGAVETPCWTESGFELSDPKLAARLRNKIAHPTFAKTIEEAADLVEAGFALRMGAHGKRASLISPASLRVTR